jgi:sugar phosphate permease
LGDYKFGNGHGGWEIYFPIWLLAFLPSAILGGVAIAGTRASGRVAWALVAVFSLTLMAAMEICFVTDAHYLVVIGVTVLLGALFFGLSLIVGRQVYTGQAPGATGDQDGFELGATRDGMHASNNPRT